MHSASTRLGDSDLNDLSLLTNVYCVGRGRAYVDSMSKLLYMSFPASHAGIGFSSLSIAQFEGRSCYYPFKSVDHAAHTTMAPHRDQQLHEVDTIHLDPIDEGAAERAAQALPPVDGGRDAWIALASCFVLEALVWGLVAVAIPMNHSQIANEAPRFPFCYGIFQSYYLTHEPFMNHNPAGIAAISTTASAIMYLSSPLVAVACQRYPGWRIPAGLAGLAIMVSGLVIASFCNSVGGLLATQGVMYAIGGVVLYFPAMYVIDEWFVARKGLAFGIVWTGTGTAGM